MPKGTVAPGKVWPSGPVPIKGSTRASLACPERASCAGDPICWAREAIDKAHRQTKATQNRVDDRFTPPPRDQSESYRTRCLQVQSMHLCVAQVPHIAVNFFATALLARWRRTDALLGVVLRALAKDSTDSPARSTCSIAARYSGFRSRMTS